MRPRSTLLSPFRGTGATEHHAAQAAFVACSQAWSPTPTNHHGSNLALCHASNCFLLWRLRKTCAPKLRASRGSPGFKNWKNGTHACATCPTHPGPGQQGPHYEAGGGEEEQRRNGVHANEHLDVQAGAMAGGKVCTPFTLRVSLNTSFGVAFLGAHMHGSKAVASVWHALCTCCYVLLLLLLLLLQTKSE